MQAIILNYRRGRHTLYHNQLILKVEEIKSREEAAKLLGKRVVYKTKSGKEIFGKITRVHGNKGNVIARFSKGLPGQALGCKVDIL